MSSRRIVRKWESYFARVTLPEGGETSFSLGRDSGRADTLYDAIVCAMGRGKTPEQIRSAIREGRDPLADESKAAPVRTGMTVAAAANRWLWQRD